jgi:hypothetical protein
MKGKLDGSHLYVELYRDRLVDTFNRLVELVLGKKGRKEGVTVVDCANGVGG